jgi:hypothetical protein
MLKISWSFKNVSPGGYNSGHVSISSNDGFASSDSPPSSPMLLLPTVTLLIDSVTAMEEQVNWPNAWFEFICLESNFIILLRKQDNQIIISQNEATLFIGEKIHFFRALMDGATEILNEAITKLAGDRDEIEDLSNAIRDLMPLVK